MRRGTPNKGYTVIELLAMLAIVGILFRIALPNIVAWLPVFRLGAAARQIATDLQLARAQAIAKNTSQSITFDNSAGSYTFGSEFRSLPSLFPGILISSSSNTTFTPRGTASAATVTLSDGTNQRLVCVKTMGRIMIRVTSCS
jgi:type II secretory pathway pseudopilin PulG